ncbi:MAG: lysophospholipid acyltransferase family protein [Bdellovibrionales bacterium]
MGTDLTSGKEATFKGGLRLLGFFGLVLAFVPSFLLIRRFRPQIVYSWPRFFHKILSQILGFKIVVRGQVSDKKPTVFVSNHSSYLDIPVLGSIIPGSFVAKSEVNSWPFFGFLSRLQDTVFIERRAVRAGLQGKILYDRLNKGDNLILFPEGTSSDGQHTLPFKSSLFGTLEKDLDGGRKVFVQPVSIVCTRVAGMPMGHLWRPYYAWYGDMTLVGHLWDVFKIGSFTAEVTFHEPVVMDDFGGDRKRLSHHCHKQVARGVSKSVAGRH